MTRPQSHTTISGSARTDQQVHEDAVQRLDAARHERERLREADGEAEGTEEQLSAGVELSAANERVAAREAWLGYLERGY